MVLLRKVTTQNNKNNKALSTQKTTINGYFRFVFEENLGREIN